MFRGNVVVRVELNISNNTPESTARGSISTYLLSSDPAVSSYYLIVVPVMICLCFLAVLGNAYILACVPWIRKRGMTVNLVLSLGLAGADAWAAALVLTGLVVHSYLPIVHGVTLGRYSLCYFLVFELVRLAGMVTSNMHLFALALNHWFSIVSPLKYKTAATTRWCRTVMFLLWMLPLFVMIIAAVSAPGQGFRGGGDSLCNIDFYFRFPFRLVIFLQFVIPLITTLIIYCYILRRLAVARNSKPSGDSSQQHALMGKVRQRGGSATNGAMEEGARRKSAAVEMRKNSRSNVLQSKVKALTTTLLILGTFAIGWLPAVMQFALVCIDCAVSYYPPRPALFAAGVVVNCLIVVKLLINPLIYAFRILEIQYALWRMHATRFGFRNVPLRVELPHKFRNLDDRRRTSQFTSTMSAKSRRKDRRHSSFRSDANDDDCGRP